MVSLEETVVVGDLIKTLIALGRAIYATYDVDAGDVVEQAACCCCASVNSTLRH